jgi:hypothetical protein
MRAAEGPGVSTDGTEYLVEQQIMSHCHPRFDPLHILQVQYP